MNLAVTKKISGTLRTGVCVWGEGGSLVIFVQDYSNFHRTGACTNTMSPLYTFVTMKISEKNYTDVCICRIKFYQYLRHVLL